MPVTLPRAASCIVALVMALANLGYAAELFRPVPDNALVTRFTQFNLQYQLRDVNSANIEKVEFYITEDMGRTWRLYGEDRDRTPPMVIEVPGEGVYGFVSVVSSRSGSEREPGPRTRPEIVVVVDQKPPTARWLSPTQTIIGRGQPVELAWEASDPYLGPGPVRIQYAVDANSNRDRDAVWQSLEEGLPAVGQMVWAPPADTSARYNFRLIAEDRGGNYTVVYNAATVVVDSVPPMISGVLPERSNRLRVDIEVRADDGPSGSGIKEYALYTSDNGGGTWSLVKELGPNSESIPVKRGIDQPITFEAPNAGTYNLWPVVFDEAGNGTPLPPVGSGGPYSLVIDNEPPVVSLSNSFLMGRSAVLANETRTVEWTAYDPHLEANSGIMYLSLDNGNTWQELRSFLPASGSEVINFPFGSQSEEARLKVTVRDEFGNVGEGESETFKLSAADTIIESVTPSPAQPFDPIFGSDGGQAPVIPSTPIGPGSFPPPVEPSQPTIIQPAPEFPIGGAGQGGFLDANQPWPSPYDPAPAAPQYPPYDPTFGQFDTGPSIPATVPGSIPDESTAGSIPRAIFESVDTGTDIPLQEETSGLGGGPAMTWNPSPGAAGGGVATTPGGTGSGFTPLPPPVSDGGLSFPLPTASQQQPDDTSVFAPPPMVPPSDLGAGSAFPDLGSSLPPLPSPGVAQPMDGLLPPLGQSATDTGSMWGGDLQLPPLEVPSSPIGEPLPPSDSSPALPPLGTPALPGESPAITAPGMGVSLRPPGTTMPSQPDEQPSIPSMPATPSLPGLDTAPTEIAPIPPVSDIDGILGAPALPTPTVGARPTNPRQLSNYYADQAKAYLDEGRVDLSLESGTQALNADDNNPRAYTALSQAHVQQDPPNFARAATLAKEATNLSRDWETWWNCADVFYRWAHARNKTVQAQIRSGQRPAADILDERNQALENARIAISNSAMLAESARESERKQIAITQGEITYLRALTIPEPVRPADSGPAMDEYRRSAAAYKASVTPVLLEALPFFQRAMQLDGVPTYRETFHLGIINFRLGGLEREAGNVTQAMTYYQEAARYLEEATTARAVPAEGPREAYYMLAFCHDQLAEQPGGGSARHKELALRYWRQTAEFYPPGSAYREYAEQRMTVLGQELGQ